MRRKHPIQDLPQMLAYCRGLRDAPGCVDVPASLYRDLVSEATKAALRRESPLTDEEATFLRSECNAVDRLGIEPRGSVEPHASKLYRLAGFLDASPVSEPLEPTAEPTTLEPSE